MRSSHRVGLSLAIIAVLGACASGGQQGAAPAAAPAEAAPAVQDGAYLTANLLGRYPGEARVTRGSNANRTQVTLTVRGGTSGEGLAWQIKRGLCSNPTGAVETARPSSYPTLTVRGDGSATFTGSINIRFPNDAPYFVEVTRSRSNDAILACGDLRPGN